MIRDVARFNAYFDSECDRCFGDIWQDDAMGFDKEEQEYICESCIFELEELYDY